MYDKNAMRVALAYPPLLYHGRIPVLTQSRIFSFTHSKEIRIYPLVMAEAATLLKQAGFEAGWMDGITEHLQMAEYWKRLDR